jgi:serine/threonine protein kinase
MELEQYAANVADVPGASQFYTSIEDPTPNNEPSNARLFPEVLREYQSKDIKEVKREGQAITFVKKLEGTQIGMGGQSKGIYEVLVDTGIEHGGRNPIYETYAAKVFNGPASDGYYGQWQEKAHGLADYYGGFICQFHGYCRNYGLEEGLEEGLGEGSREGSEKSFQKKVFESCCGLLCSCFSLAMSLFICAQKKGKKDSEKGSEKGSFCILMRKYDCSLRNAIDEEMRKNNNSGRPFIPGVAVNMICQIALGMAILHRENIMHRDLKADNVFVYKDAADNMPWSAHIGDFDISDSTMGSAYWRAPEILEAIVKQKEDGITKIPWTPMADVYSFGMTCYEVLTGDIPLKNHSRADYEGVTKRGLRPELPADLNPIMKELIVSCWHQDPLKRPTFNTIVLELKEIFHEFPVFLKMFDNMEKLPPSVNRPSTEECLSNLERIFQVFRSNYPVQLFVEPGEVDFVKLGFHFLECFKTFVRKFGYKPYLDHPSLPWSQWNARCKSIDELWRLSLELNHALPYFDERFAITRLNIYIFDAIREGQEAGNSWTEEEGFDYIQREAICGSWLEDIGRRAPLMHRHDGCLQKNNHGHYGGDKDYPICDFCKVKKPPRVENAQKHTFRMFDDKFASEA